MDWVRILAYITGTVDQELLLVHQAKLGASYRVQVPVGRGIRMISPANCL